MRTPATAVQTPTPAVQTPTTAVQTPAGAGEKEERRAPDRRPGGNYTLRLDYKHGERVCTVIYVDFLERQVAIQNYTEDVIERAFGVIEKPTWEDLEQFLLSRCFPASRGYAKDILRGLGLDSYDPLEIARVTGGRTAEDNMCLSFREYPREVSADETN